MDTPAIETRAERRARKRLEKHQPKPSSGRWRWPWLLGIVVIIGGTVWWFTSRTEPTTAQEAAQQSQRVRDLALSCTTDTATTFHIHAHLSISINGADRAVPTDVGISAACMHPLHTHDGTGIIHIESPRKEDFTLGDFMAVWQEDFTSAKVLDTTIDGQHQLTLFVNGKVVTTAGATVLHDHDSVAMYVAAPDTSIAPPDNYTFPTTL